MIDLLCIIIVNGLFNSAPILMYMKPERKNRYSYFMIQEGVPDYLKATIISGYLI